MSKWNNYKPSYTTIALTNCCHARTQTKSVDSFLPTAERMPEVAQFSSNREIFEVGDDASEAEVDEIDDFDCCERG